MTDFVNAAKCGDHKEKGWVESAYSVSEIGVNLITFAQQREFNRDSRQVIIVTPVALEMWIQTCHHIQD